MTAACCSPDRQRNWWPTRMCDGCISARASRSDVMSLAPRLDLRQSQSLVMTPQLQQAIRLLALSNLEIEAFISEELEKNPLIETGGDDVASAPEPDGDFDGDPSEPTNSLAGLSGAGDDAPLDADFAAETFHHDSPSDSPGRQGMDGSLGMAGAGNGGSEGG